MKKRKAIRMRNSRIRPSGDHLAVPTRIPTQYSWLWTSRTERTWKGVHRRLSQGNTGPSKGENSKTSGCHRLSPGRLTAGAATSERWPPLGAPAPRRTSPPAGDDLISGPYKRAAGGRRRCRDTHPTVLFASQPTRGPRPPPRLISAPPAVPGTFLGK